MIAKTVENLPTTMSSLKDQAMELTDNLKSVRRRLWTLRDAMGGSSMALEKKENSDRGRAPGSVDEIGLRMCDSMSVVGEIEDTLNEIESVVLSDEKVEAGCLEK